MNDPAKLGDVRRSDLLTAAAVTVAVFVGVGLAFAHARLAHHAELPVIDPGLGVPIAVRPLADLGPGTGVAEAGRAGSGGGATSQVPRAWRRHAKPSPPPDPTSFEPPWSMESIPTPTPAVEHSATTPKPRPRAHEQTPDPSVLPTEPTEPTQPTEEVDEDGVPVESEPLEESAAAEQDSPPIETDAPASEGESEGAGTGGTEGVGDGQGGPTEEGEGQGPGGGSGSGGDPLFDRAVAFYRARLVAWFSARFRVTGSGLSPEELAKLRVRVQIDIGEDLTITGYRVLSSDHPAFDSAARSMLDKLSGVSLPAPPENYPGAVQRHLTVTFTCAEDTCD